MTEKFYSSAFIPHRDGTSNTIELELLSLIFHKDKGASELILPRALSRQTNIKPICGFQMSLHDHRNRLKDYNVYRPGIDHLGWKDATLSQIKTWTGVDVRRLNSLTYSTNAHYILGQCILESSGVKIFQIQEHDDATELFIKVDWQAQSTDISAYKLENNIRDNRNYEETIMLWHNAKLYCHIGHFCSQNGADLWVLPIKDNIMVD